MIALAARDIAAEHPTTANVSDAELVTALWERATLHYVAGNMALGDTAAADARGLLQKMRERNEVAS